MKTFDQLLVEWKDENKSWDKDGKKGVDNLNLLCFHMGYSKTPKTSSIEAFLEKNPGAIDAIHNYMKKQKSQEWKDNLTKNKIPPNSWFGTDEKVYVALFIGGKLKTILAPNKRGDGYYAMWHYRDKLPTGTFPVNPAVNPHVTFLLVSTAEAANLTYVI